MKHSQVENDELNEQILAWLQPMKNRVNQEKQ